MTVHDGDFALDRARLVGNIDAILDFHANTFSPQLKTIIEGGAYRLEIEFRIVANELRKLFERHV